jgi:hypothetical protein
MAQQCHNHAMGRRRVSTTVDEGLLEQARGLHGGTTDAALFDDALRALVAHHRSTEIDSAYRAYDKHPIDESDEWGDLASFHAAAEGS